MFFKMEIQGYSNYLIYPDGRVYNQKFNRFLKSSINIKGYLVNNINKKKKGGGERMGKGDFMW